MAGLRSAGGKDRFMTNAVINIQIILIMCINDSRAQFGYYWFNCLHNIQKRNRIESIVGEIKMRYGSHAEQVCGFLCGGASIPGVIN
jgi:hypothetical protein